jgi:hypothetical protein
MPVDDEPQENLPYASRGHWMKLARTTPKVGGLLELTTSQCPNCEEVTTIENDE